MSKEHSPAPWTYDGGRVQDAEGQTIALYVDEPDGFLLKAAPDMLAALEDLLSSAEELSYACDDVDEPIKDKARAALAKARGEA